MTARAGGCFRSPPIRPHRTLPGGSKLEHVSPDLAQSRPGTACRHGCGGAWADRFLLLSDDPPVHAGHGPALQRSGPQGRRRHRPPARRAEGPPSGQCRGHQDHGAGRSGRTPSDGDGAGRIAGRRFDRLRDLRQAGRLRHHQLRPGRQPSARDRRGAGAHGGDPGAGPAGARPSGAAQARDVQPHPADRDRQRVPEAAARTAVEARAGRSDPAPDRRRGSPAGTEPDLHHRRPRQPAGARHGHRRRRQLPRPTPTRRSWPTSSGRPA